MDLSNELNQDNETSLFYPFDKGWAGEFPLPPLDHPRLFYSYRVNEIMLHGNKGDAMQDM
jgi:hypothetical protein